MPTDSTKHIPYATPRNREVSSYAERDLHTSGKKPSVIMDSTPSKPGPRLSNAGTKPHNTISASNKPKTTHLSKTLAARPQKARPSVQDLFASPSSGAQGTASSKPQNTRKSLAATTPKEKLSALDSNQEQPRHSPKSSAALRETIAKAKAARRDVAKFQSKWTARPPQELSSFPKIELGGGGEDLLRNRVVAARTDGRLNIAALELTEVPPEVLNMYQGDSTGVAWYESVDLVRLIAADNEFEALPGHAFPDNGPSEDNDSRGNVFACLETLDLHGNRLKQLPLGLGRLERLTILNLSKNNLSNDSLQIISRVLSLRELRIGSNGFEGALSSQLCALSNLEILDLQGNALSALPNKLQDLASLHVLDLSGNKFVSLPFEILAFASLIELNAARNRLSGSLFPANFDGLAHLKSLNVANNALLSITADRLVNLPRLLYLDVNENRLKFLPDVSGFTELHTLLAGGNKLTSYPEGVTSLQQLKTVDLSRNDLKTVDERFGLLEQLTVLRVANNPLRERKFLTMDTGEMKRELRSRIQPDDAQDDLASSKGPGPVGYNAAANAWHVKAGGILDMSHTQLETIEPLDFRKLAESNDVKTCFLHHNSLPLLPQALSIASTTMTKLDLSHNKLAGSEYLPIELSLLSVKSLNISFNSIASLAPLLERFVAPALTELNVSRNRLTVLTPLREAFPSLMTIHASGNKISELHVNAVAGLQVLDVSGNEIGHLEPKLGLLGEQGLRTLLLNGNTFRVPRREVVDKGTGAVLAWLRTRIPEDEIQTLH